MKIHEAMVVIALIALGIAIPTTITGSMLGVGIVLLLVGTCIGIAIRLPTKQKNIIYQKKHELNQ